MIKTFDDMTVVKVCDFSLVKHPNSDLIFIDTVLKGCYNDPNLNIEGFRNYTVIHETYAFTRIIAFILTGKTTVYRIQDINLKSFVEKWGIF